jgi:hypothetical protein
MQTTFARVQMMPARVRFQWWRQDRGERWRGGFSRTM